MTTHLPPEIRPDPQEIIVDVDLHRMVDESIGALAPLDVFQRSGTLVDVVRDVDSSDGITRPAGVGRIRLMPDARLREMLSQAARFKKWRKFGRGEPQLVDTTIPSDVVAAVAARGQWTGIRRLLGIVEWPVLRADGSVLASPGYDHRTALIYEPSCDVAVPDRPTLGDAQDAASELLELVCDFPFVENAGKSAYLACLLTVLARPAIDGPCPLLVITAPERGTGKSLLADTIGGILRGKPLPRRTAPTDPAEWRKTMLGIGIAGEPVLLLDNVVNMLRSDALDAVLTGTQFSERILGRNENLTVDIRTVFLATMNNGQLSTDLVRRSLEARLEAEVERPEQRTEFRYPNLLEHVRKSRPSLLRAALTMLRAYAVAGRPRVEMRPMGSYEAWSSVVRATLVWCGLADPALTQDSLREHSDPEQEALTEMLAAWHTVYGSRPKTIKALLDDLSDPNLPDRERDLRHALGTLCDAEPGRLPPSRKVGNRLKAARNRIVGGLRLERGPKSKHGVTWRVRSLEGDSGDSGDSDSQSSRESNHRFLSERELETPSLESPESPLELFEGGEW